MTRSNVSPEEATISFSGPAAAVNRFVVHTRPSGMRIAFMEVVPETMERCFRSAVLLSESDAKALADLLLHMLAQPGQVKKEASDA